MQRINSRLGSWRLSRQARLRAASWYRESDGGYDGLGAQARCAESTANERDAGQLARCDGITEELTCSSVQKRGAAEACWRQGSAGDTEQFVGVGDRMRTEGMHKVRRWNAECSSRCRCGADVRRSGVRGVRGCEAFAGRRRLGLGRCPLCRWHSQVHLDKPGKRRRGRLPCNGHSACEIF